MSIEITTKKGNIVTYEMGKLTFNGGHHKVLAYRTEQLVIQYDNKQRTAFVDINQSEMDKIERYQNNNKKQPSTEFLEKVRVEREIESKENQLHHMMTMGEPLD
jgi:hypothetical protein